MPEQQVDHRSPPATAASSDEPQPPSRSGPMTGGSAAATSAATAGDMAGGGASGEEERGPEEAGHGPDNVRSPWAALLSIISLSSLVSVSSHLAGPQFQRKPRSQVHRAAAPSHKWADFKLPVLPPAPPKKRTRNSKPRKKRDTPCTLCDATETPLWRTWPTDRRVPLCNACGIQVRTPGVLLPELLYLPHPATATVVSELEQPVPLPQQIVHPVIVSNSPRSVVLPKKVRVNLFPPPPTATTTVLPEVEQPPPQEIQESESPPDSPILDSLLDVDIYLLKRTVPRQRKSPAPPPPPAESEPAAVAPAAGNDEDKRPEPWCRHCSITYTLQWRTGPKGERTLCNACGVAYKKGRLVPEYRPRASPTFDASVHSNDHRTVLQLRLKQANPAPPAPYLPVKPRMNRRKFKRQQQETAAQARKKHKGSRGSSSEAAAVAMHQPPPLPPHLPPPPPPPELPQAAADNVMEEHLEPPLPPAEPPAGDDLMMGPPGFLLDGPSAPMIIEDNEPMVMIVIDDD